MKVARHSYGNTLQVILLIFHLVIAAEGDDQPFHWGSWNTGISCWLPSLWHPLLIVLHDLPVEYHFWLIIHLPNSLTPPPSAFIQPDNINNSLNCLFGFFGPIVAYFVPLWIIAKIAFCNGYRSRICVFKATVTSNEKYHQDFLSIVLLSFSVWLRGGFFHFTFHHCSSESNLLS